MLDDLNHFMAIRKDQNFNPLQTQNSITESRQYHNSQPIIKAGVPERRGGRGGTPNISANQGNK